MVKQKDLHVMLPQQQHRNFFVRCKEKGTPASKIVRQWINEFLRGEKA